MSLDQMKGTEVTIKKGEGITQAIDRVAKEKNIQITKSELLDLAVQVSKEAQFKGRKITEYTVGGKKYEAVSLVHAGEKFKIQGNTPASISVAPSIQAPASAIAPVAPASAANKSVPAVSTQVPPVAPITKAVPPTAPVATPTVVPASVAPAKSASVPAAVASVPAAPVAKPAASAAPAPKGPAVVTKDRSDR